MVYFDFVMDVLSGFFCYIVLVKLVINVYLDLNNGDVDFIYG